MLPLINTGNVWYKESWRWRSTASRDKDITAAIMAQRAPDRVIDWQDHCFLPPSMGLHKESSQQQEGHSSFLPAPIYCLHRHYLFYNARDFSNLSRLVSSPRNSSANRYHARGNSSGSSTASHCSVACEQLYRFKSTWTFTNSTSCEECRISPPYFSANSFSEKEGSFT